MIEFSEEQAMLLESAMDFCGRQSPIARVRQKMDSGEVLDAGLWQQVVDLGWTAIAIPEAHGGLGLTLDSVVPVSESMGRHLMASPFLATQLAIQALLAGDNDAVSAHWLPRLASGAIGTVALIEADGNWALDDVAVTATRHGDQLRLSGMKHQVLDAAHADVVLVSARLDGELVLVAVPGVADRAQREVVVDETRASYAVSFDGIEVPADQVLSAQALVTVEHAALLLLSAEMAGGIYSTLAVIVEYLKTRKQFDRLIGSYQALKHPAADILLSAEAARSHVYHAGTLWAQSDPALETALRIAKAQTSEAFAEAGDRAIQFHGGMGFTWECDAQLFLRRALWCQYQYGDEKHHRQLLAPLLLDDTA